MTRNASLAYRYRRALLGELKTYTLLPPSHVQSDPGRSFWKRYWMSLTGVRVMRLKETQSTSDGELRKIGGVSESSEHPEVLRVTLELARGLILDRTAGGRRDRIRDIVADYANARAVSKSSREEVVEGLAKNLSLELADAALCRGPFEQLHHLDNAIILARDLFLAIAGDDLANLDLSGLDFTGIDLRHAHIENSTLLGVVWSDNTRWPPDFEEKILRLSDEIHPGIHRVARP